MFSVGRTRYVTRQYVFQDKVNERSVMGAKVCGREKEHLEMMVRPTDYGGFDVRLATGTVTEEAAKMHPTQHFAGVVHSSKFCLTTLPAHQRFRVLSIPQQCPEPGRKQRLPQAKVFHVFRPSSRDLQSRAADRGAIKKTHVKHEGVQLDTT